jgi:hypothetical protein
LVKKGESDKTDNVPRVEKMPLTHRLLSEVSILWFSTIEETRKMFVANNLAKPQTNRGNCVDSAKHENKSELKSKRKNRLYNIR